MSPPQVDFTLSATPATPAPPASPTVDVKMEAGGGEPSSPALPATPATAPAPSIDDPWSVEFELRSDSVGLKWKPIPGAIRYFVEMAPDSYLLKRIWMGTVETPEALAPLHGFIPRGPVYVRLTAVNANAEEVSSAVRSSLLGRQTDLPSGIKGITVTTQQAAPPPAPPPRKVWKWGRPTYSRDLTLVSGKFGGERYNNYLISNGLDWSADSPSATLSTGARLLYTTNDRQGLRFGQGDANLSTYLFLGMKRIPLTLSYNSYFYRQLQGDTTRSVHNIGVGYTPTPRLSLGAQVTPNPKYASLWGSWAVGRGSLLFQFITSDYSDAVTLTYQTQQILR